MSLFAPKMTNQQQKQMEQVELEMMQDMYNRLDKILASMTRKERVAKKRRQLMPLHRHSRIIEYYF